MARGGLRIGAGRPKGQGKYQEATRPVRVPVSKIDDVLKIISNTSCEIPLYGGGVSAGFPSPSDDYVEDVIDLNKHLIKHPTATFLVRAKGDSMINASINSGDILVVDRSLDAQNGKIIIAAINGELTVKRLKKSANGVFLMPENDQFDPIEITQEQDVVIWGVVTSVIHQL
jgi:DNA polymerase V